MIVHRVPEENSPQLYIFADKFLRVWKMKLAICCDYPSKCLYTSCLSSQWIFSFLLLSLHYHAANMPKLLSLKTLVAAL